MKATSKNKKVVFLDRDGVINKDPQEKRYVTRSADLEFLPGSVEAIKRLNDSGFEVFVISNQAGIAKGLFAKEELDSVTAHMLRELKKNGASVAGVYYCHHRDEDSCDCRKPKTGLLKRALGNADIRKNGTYFVGDSTRDVKAGRAFGLKTILVLSGKTRLEDVKTWDVKPDYIMKDLAEAAEQIISDAK